jgi:sugar-specific transcriptional regulator TrmB
MDRIKKVLTEFGLTDNEIKVYREVLKHEEASPFKIAKLTGIPRTTVYDVMMNLSLKGLITLLHNQGLEKQQTKIKAVNPSKLRQIILKRRKSLAKLEVDIVDILPHLKGDFHRGKTNANFQFFPGIGGARKVLLNEEVQSAEFPTYIWTHLMPMDSFGIKEMNKAVSEELDKRRKLGTRAKNIISLTDWTRHVLSYQYGRDKNYIKYNEFRFIENPVFSVNQEIYLKADKISIACADNDEAWGLVIRSTSLSKTLRSMFELMWLSALPVTSELVKSWGENEFLTAQKEK